MACAKGGGRNFEAGGDSGKERVRSIGVGKSRKIPPCKRCKRPRPQLISSHYGVLVYIESCPHVTTWLVLADICLHVFSSFFKNLIFFWPCLIVLFFHHPN